MKRVVVIGAGFAGLTAAAALAARGQRVTVLEAAGEVGGKAQRVLAAGAAVDLGPTILTDLEPLRALFAESGLAPEDVVGLERLDPDLVATFQGGPSLALRQDARAMADELRGLGPEAPQDWRRFLTLGERASRLAAHFWSRGDVAGTRDLLRFLVGGRASLADAAVLARHGSLARLLSDQLRTPALREFLGHFSRFIGLEAARAPAVTLVIPYLLATAGIVYPHGGCSGLARAILDVAAKHGAVLDTGTPVVGLDVSGGRFRAALTATGRRVEGEACVAAVDASVTGRWLPAGTGRPRRTERAHAARVAWWVVEGRPRLAVHHALHFDVPDEHPLYVAVPTTTEPALAPPGASVVYALLHGPVGAPATPEFGEAVRARIVRAGQWPEGRVLAQGLAGGEASAYGDAIGLGLFSSFRPSQRIPGVRHLVRAGASVFPGPGLANVVRSGLRAADLVTGEARR